MNEKGEALSTKILMNEGSYTYTSNDRRYSVNIARDGAVLVKENDWLSKYSWAMHDDYFIGVPEFRRPTKQGKLEIIANQNLIYKHETLYHYPTYMEYTRTRSGPQQRADMLTDLKGKFNLNGEHLHILSNVYEIVEPVERAIFVLEIAGWLGHGALAAAGSAVGIAAALMWPIFAMIQFWNVHEISEKWYGMRAVAYTGTAWAFEIYPSPMESRTYMDMFIRQRMSDENIRRHQQAWAKAAEEARMLCNRELIRMGAKDPETVHLMWQATGDNDPKKLCLLMLQALGERLPVGQERPHWADGYKVLYPD